MISQVQFSYSQTLSSFISDLVLYHSQINIYNYAFGLFHCWQGAAYIFT